MFCNLIWELDTQVYAYAKIHSIVQLRFVEFMEAIPHEKEEAEEWEEKDKD